MDTQLSKIIRPLPPIPRTSSGFGRTGRTKRMQPNAYCSVFLSCLASEIVVRCSMSCWPGIG